LDNINIHRVLIAPLDWGLGHATRCIPIIHSLQSLDFEVIIAAEGAGAKLLKAEFPNIRIIHLLGYQIRYTKTPIGLLWKILWQVPNIIKSINKEHTWLEKIIKDENIDLVISDNRYGLYSSQIPCVFITHQLLIKTPFSIFDRLLQKINYRFINRFSACWVPDSAMEKNVAGKLSHPKKIPRTPVHYIGILTRMLQASNRSTKFKNCFLLSGPEPQRSILEKQIISVLEQISGPNILVRGLPTSATAIKVPANTLVVNHIATIELGAILTSSELIICRSGYTSIMELIGLQKKALLIPTPGQTEQEYLAQKLFSEQRFFMHTQLGLNLSHAIDLAKHFQPVYADISIFTTKTLEALLLAL